MHQFHSREWGWFLGYRTSTILTLNTCLIITVPQYKIGFRLSYPTSGRTILPNRKIKLRFGLLPRSTSSMGNY